MIGELFASIGAIRGQTLTEDPQRRAHKNTSQSFLAGAIECVSNGIRRAEDRHLIPYNASAGLAPDRSNKWQLLRSPRVSPWDDVAINSWLFVAFSGLGEALDLHASPEHRKQSLILVKHSNPALCDAAGGIFSAGGGNRCV